MKISGKKINGITLALCIFFALATGGLAFWFERFTAQQKAGGSALGFLLGSAYASGFETFCFLFAVISGILAIYRWVRWPPGVRR